MRQQDLNKRQGASEGEKTAVMFIELLPVFISGEGEMVPLHIRTAGRYQSDTHTASRQIDCKPARQPQRMKRETQRARAHFELRLNDSVLYGTADGNLTFYFISGVNCRHESAEGKCMICIMGPVS